MLRIPPQTSLLIGVGAIALVGGAALLAGYLLGKFPAYRFFRRACVNFAAFCGFAGIATILQVTFPLLYRQPYETLLNVGWLTLSVVLSVSLLWSARGLKESGGLLIMLGTTSMILIGNVLPLLPAPPTPDRACYRLDRARNSIRPALLVALAEVSESPLPYP